MARFDPARFRRIHSFVDTLKVDDKIKAELKKVTPYNYVGYS